MIAGALVAAAPRARADVGVGGLYGELALTLTLVDGDDDDHAVDGGGGVGVRGCF